MIKTVIFDIGNVLMRFDYDSYVKELLKDDALISRINDAMWKTGYWNELDLGHDAEQVFSKIYAAAPDLENKIRLVLYNIRECIKNEDYAKGWVRDLKDAGYQVLFLSNYSKYIMGARPDVLDFIPLMDGGVFSCHVGMLKPDPAIYQKICDTYNLKPEDCVFIDDNADNINAARDFGLHVIHFKDYGQARGELEALLQIKGQKYTEKALEIPERKAFRDSEQEPEAGAAFRKMRRFKQQISQEECIEILKTQKRGVLSMTGDYGYPYGIPLDHWYCEEDGRIYFHGAKEGHKIDSIIKCDKVSYCVYDEGYKKPGEWALNIKSVIVFGRIRPVDDEEKAREICSRLVQKFTDDQEYLEKELKHAFHRVLCLELVPDHMTGKLVNEA